MSTSTDFVCCLNKQTQPFLQRPSTFDDIILHLHERSNILVGPTLVQTTPARPTLRPQSLAYILARFHVDCRVGLIAMTRRHTIGSRSELGLLEDTPEPQTPPPVWTPALSQTKYTWQKPSKWQMPRPRSVTKVVAAFVLSIFLYQLLYHKPPDAPSPPPTEEQLRQAGLQERWAWKEFPPYVILYALVYRMLLRSRPDMME